MTHLPRIPACRVGSRARVAVGAPAGFVQVFPGWNVWDVWQADDQKLGVVDSVMLAGVGNERRLRIFVEDWLREHDTQAQVADHWNGALKGDAIDIVPNAAGLSVLQTRADVPGLAGSQQRGEPNSPVKLWTVRFFNRSSAPSAVAWPTDDNYLLEQVYQPATNNPLTNAPAPRSTLDDVAKGAGEVIKVVAIVGGIALGAVLVVQLVQAGRSRRSAS